MIRSIFWDYSVNKYRDKLRARTEDGTNSTGKSRCRTETMKMVKTGYAHGKKLNLFPISVLFCEGVESPPLYFALLSIGHQEF